MFLKRYREVGGKSLIDIMLLVYVSILGCIDSLGDPREPLEFIESSLLLLLLTKVV